MCFKPTSTDRHIVYVSTVYTVSQVMAVMGEGGGVTPALGLAWASQVGTRIMLSRDDTLHSDLDLCKVPPALSPDSWSQAVTIICCFWCLYHSV